MHHALGQDLTNVYHAIGRLLHRPSPCCCSRGREDVGAMEAVDSPYTLGLPEQFDASRAKGVNGELELSVGPELQLGTCSNGLVAIADDVALSSEDISQVQAQRSVSRKASAAVRRARGNAHHLRIQTTEQGCEEESSPAPQPGEDRGELVSQGRDDGRDGHHCAGPDTNDGTSASEPVTNEVREDAECWASAKQQGSAYGPGSSHSSISEPGDQGSIRSNDGGAHMQFQGASLAVSGHSKGGQCQPVSRRQMAVRPPLPSASDSEASADGKHQQHGDTAGCLKEEMNAASTALQQRHGDEQLSLQHEAGLDASPSQQHSAADQPASAKEAPSSLAAD